MSAREHRLQAAPRRRWRIVLSLLALAIAAYLALPLLSRSTWVRERVERTAAQISGMEVEIERVALGYDLALHVFGVSLSNDNRAPFVMADRITAGISLPGLFSGQPIRLGLYGPRLFVGNLPQSTGEPSQAGARSGDSDEMSLPFFSIVVEDGYVVTSTDTIGPITVSVDAIRAKEEAVVAVEVDPRLPPLEIAATFATPEGELGLVVARLSWRGVPLTVLAERFPEIAGGAAIEGSLDLSGNASGSSDSLTGSGHLSIRGFKYHTDAFEIAGDVQAPVVLTGDVIEFKDQGLQLGGPTFAFADVSGQASQAAIVGSIRLDGGRVRGEGKLHIAGVQAHDPAYERVIESTEIDGTLQAVWDPEVPPMLRLDLSVPRGEVLWDRYYADISRHPVKLGSEIRNADRSIELSKIDAQADGIGRIQGEARLQSATAIERLAARIDIANLGNLYVLALRDPYKESFNFLETTTVGGKLSAHIDYSRKAETFALTGDLRVTGASVTAEDQGLELQGLNLHLPLQLGGVNKTAPANGELRVAGLRVGNVVFGGFDAALAVRPNVVELMRPVAVDLLGGELRLLHLLAESLEAEPRVALGIALNGVDLDALTTAMSLPPLRGTLSGAIPKVTATGDEVRSEGEIRIQAFEGRIAIRNVSVEQLFSSVPTLGLDLDFEEISLGELTEAFEVGRITGVAQGGARNLAIVSGQPLSFDAWMETVERSGVPQRISVSAIRQLSILGGSGGDPFSQGILGLFDEYRYAQMGFRCRLENDRFRLRGVETIDGKEYLVVGSFLPPRVNVVSHTTVISFSEMVRRLQRIGAASSAEGEGEKS